MKTPHEFKVMRVRECVSPSALIDTPEQAVAYWRANLPAADWYDPSKEMFVVLALNTRRRLIGHNLVTIGTLDTCTVHPREVFKPAIAVSGSAILLAHNHPSGDPTPSEADIKVTRDLIRAGQLLKIEVIDHVIVGAATPASRDYVSLRELGFFAV